MGKLDREAAIKTLVAAVAYLKTNPLPVHYAGLDETIDKGIPAYVDALKKAGVDYTVYMYEGAQHSFNDDTNPARYNKEAADPCAR
jgi:dienelactone hydrolase